MNRWNGRDGKIESMNENVWNVFGFQQIDFINDGFQVGVRHNREQVGAGNRVGTGSDIVAFDTTAATRVSCGHFVCFE